MIDNNKRLIILLLAMLSLSTLILAANVRKVDFAANGNHATLSNNTDYGFDLQFKLQDYSLEEITSKFGTFDRLSIEGYGVSNRIGEPQLPVYSRLIAVPVGANVEFVFVKKDQLTISKSDAKLLNRIMPAQASVSKSANPDLLPFELKNEVYTRNEVSNNDLFKVEEIGYMRGVRMFKFDYEPIQYNPSTGELKVCSDAYIKVNFVGADMAATKNLIDRTASYEYDNLYAKSFMNWKAPDRASLVRYPTKILILCPAAYTTTLQPFVDWKKQQGYTVVVTTVGTGGTVTNTSAAIKTYMGTVWAAGTTLDPAPTYLIIVGDTGTTGNNVTATAATVTDPSSAHVTDNYYVRLSGTDYVPEMYYGRFSVSSATELTSVINKTITWEKTAMTDLSYLGKAVMIAGQDTTYGPTHGDGAIKYGTQNYFNSTFGITSNTYLYAVSGSSDATIIANANEGRGYINYTAHGSETGWYDPSFSVSNVNSMTNTGKYGVMVGNCCLTNAFDTGVCFGESIIRKYNAGGVAYIGGTNSTYWDEDYWWGVGSKGTANGTAPAYSASALGTYDAMFHSHSEATTNWANTLGDMIYMGNLAVNQGGSSYINYYWEIYSIMGDPSLMPYQGVPTTNTATYPSSILMNATSITVTAAPYSRVALTMGGVNYGTAIVPAGGSLTLPITPFASVGTAQLVITAQNKITRIENITIAPNSGAYMSVDANTYNDANNSVAEYNETGRFTTTFKNVGSITSSATTATLTCATAGITITDGTESIAALAAGASVVKTNAFSFTVANNIVNQLSAAFTITMVSGTNTWTYNFNQVFAAPALAFGTMTISDPTGNNNGRLDPGETVTINMPLNNTGAAASIAGSATLSCATTGITVNTGTANYSAIAAAGSTSLSFSVNAASSMSVGTLASMVFAATAGQYTASKTQSAEVGAPTEITIGTGTSTQDYPIDRYYNYSAHEAIYLASEIGIAGTIKSIAYYKSSGADLTTIDPVTIYMKNTSSSTMATGTYSTTGYTQVYSGTYPNTSASGWMEVNLSTQFLFDGISNLSLLVVKGNQTYTTDRPLWTYSTSSTYRARQDHSDTAAPTSLTYTTSLPNMKLKMFPAVGLLYPPQNLAATATHASVSLTWTAPVSGSPTGYKIYRNSSPLTTVTALSYTDAAVTDGTTYSYYLKAAYSGGDSDATSTVSATPNIVAPTNLTASPGNSVINLSWIGATGRSEEKIVTKDTRTISGYKIYRNSVALTTVTGTTYQNTGLTNGSSYSYYVTTLYTNPAGESAASNTATATPAAITSVIIGTGTASTGTYDASPVSVYYQSLHGQSVYTAAELTAAGIVGPINITQLGFNITALPTKTMPSFVVRMKHTTSTNVASWIDATSLVTVYANASYLPTATGYNMYTLSTPFLWNGTDNIVIDTAFGLIGNYATTGTVQYTSVTNGYRYTRSDTADQTLVFSGSGTQNTTSSYRPNVKFAFAPTTTSPQIGITPQSLAYGDVAVGGNSTQSFTISNLGGGTLTGTITTPTGYIVAATSKEERNVLSFSVVAGTPKTYNLTLTPTAATAYNGNVLISSNSETMGTFNLAVTGAGYIPPTIAVDVAELTASLMNGEESSDTFSISNTGSQALNYSIGLTEVRSRGIVIASRKAKLSDDKSIAGSTFVVDVTEYTPGTTEDWIFTVTNASTDTEWMKDIYITFPAGVTVNSVTNFVGGAGGDMTPDVTSGTGVTINWHGETSSGYGVVYGNNGTASATVNVTVAAGLTADMNLAYTLNGDVFGDEPHTITNTIILPASVAPVQWFSAAPLSGTIAAGAYQTITGSFSAVGMEAGLYEALLTINSNDPINPTKEVQILMEVFAGNRPPQISLPTSFTFEKNGSLVQSFASYISDPDDDPITLSVTGNSNVNVSIVGNSVTFTAAQNWCGTETITFTVSDGEYSTNDNVDIIVTPTDMPSWQPVVYPTNPATVYAVVTIDNIPAQLNDVVAAFVNGECRATGQIVMIGKSVAYTTLVVNLSNSGETVSFKIYAHATDTVYPVPEEMPMTSGVVYGETTPVPLNGTLTVVIAQPMLAIETSVSGSRLAWTAVTNATNYQIWACSEPYGEYQYLESTSSLYWNINPTADKMFYKIIADNNAPAKGTK